MVFGETGCKLRTDASFRAKTNEDHHIKSSIVEELPINIINSFPLDYLHLVLQGVMKKMMNLLIRGKGTVAKLSSKDQEKISRKMLNVSKYIPSEFSRKCRSLKDLVHFKGTEYRLILLYVGPIVFRNVLDEHLYNHFLLFHVAITICSSKEYFKYLEVAENMLSTFVEIFKDLYGEINCSYNVHSLTHLVEDVRNCGDINSFSAFPYENELGHLKKIPKTGNKPLVQVAKRISERLTLPSKPEIQIYPLMKHLVINASIPNCSKLYTTLITKTFKLDYTLKNCWFMTKSHEIVKFLYATEYEGSTAVFGSSIKSKMDFYEKPIHSSYMNIYKAHLNLNDPVIWPYSSIYSKLFCVFLKRNEFVFFPILHSVCE